MRDNDRINVIIEHRALRLREDNDDCRSQSINERNEKIRGIRENAGTAKPEPDMVVEAVETVSAERTDTSQLSSDPEGESKNWIAEIYEKTERNNRKKEEKRENQSLKISQEEKLMRKQTRKDLEGVLAENVLDNKSKNGTIMAELLRSARYLVLADNILYIYDKTTGCYVPLRSQQNRNGTALSH